MLPRRRPRFLAPGGLVRPRLAVLALGAGLLLAGPAPSAAQPRGAPDAPSGLRLTVATRIDSTGAESRLLQVGVPYRSLVFTRRAGEFRAGMRVTAVARRDGRRIGGGVASAEVVVPDHAATRGDGQLVCAVPLRLPGQGRAELDVDVLVDDTSRRWRERLTVQVGEGLRVPVYFAGFAWNLDDGTQPALGAGRDTLRARVQLGRRPNVAQWPADGVTLAALATPERRQADREQLAQALRIPLAPVAVGDEVPPVELAWPAQDLDFGRLLLAVWLESGDPARPQRLDLDPARPFVNLTVRFGDDGQWRQHLGWLDGLPAEQARRDLKGVPPAGREAAWRAFWEEAAAAEGGSAAQLEAAHLRRVLEADERFGGFGRGAVTDRGRIWIRYGAPDGIEQRGDDLSMEARWEIWYYHDRNLVFTFLDAHGLGDYRLTDRARL